MAEVQGSQLPPSPVDNSHQHMDLTPSGEIQFRVRNSNVNQHDGSPRYEDSDSSDPEDHPMHGDYQGPVQHGGRRITPPQADRRRVVFRDRQDRTGWNREDAENLGEPNDLPNYGRIKYHKPDTYDGKTHWQDYLDHFELVAQINQWDRRQRALELATSLRGAAQGVLSDMPPQLRHDYQALVDMLAARFEPVNQSELYRAQMKNTLRRKGEPLAELAQDIKRLVRLAYPTAPLQVREQLARDCFTDSLNDTELEWAVFQGKCNTVDDAVREALEYEAFQKGRNGRMNGKHGVRMQREVQNERYDKQNITSQKPDDTNSMLKEILHRIEQLEKTNQEAKAVSVGQKAKKCTFCNKLGHLEEDCYRRLNRMGPKRWNQQNRNQGFEHGQGNGQRLK